MKVVGATRNEVGTSCVRRNFAKVAAENQSWTLHLRAGGIFEDVQPMPSGCCGVC